MKVIKMLICITFIAIISLLIAIIVANSSRNNKQIVEGNNINNTNAEIVLTEQEGVTDIAIDEEVKVLTDRNKFFSIEEMIKSYCLYLKVGNIEAVSSIIDNSYINEIGITSQNILQIARQNIPYDGEYSVKEIYILKNGNINIYYISGTLEVQSTKIQNYFAMYQDVTNGTFSLKPINYNQYLTYTSNNQKEEYAYSIELTQYNKFTNTLISDEEMAKKYFNSYIHNARYYPDEAYDTIDEEYKNAKFGNVQNYKTYLSNRSEELENLDYTAIRDISEFSTEQEYKKYINNLEKKSIKQYYINEEERYCVCVDEYDNYYIFNILDVMNYKLILDTYTVDLPEFLEKYQDADEQEKVELNINKIFKAINDKDYKYVYNKLEENYKNTNFSNIESFKMMLSNTIFEENNVELKEYSFAQNEHKYMLEITDRAGIKENIVSITISMSLGEETNFTIKFE